jgi:hypothetical protein
LGIPDEFHKVSDALDLAKLIHDLFAGSLEIAFGPPDAFIGMFDGLDLFGGKSGPSEPDEIGSPELGPVTHGHHVRGDVLGDPGLSPDKGMGADAHELVHG